MIRTLSLDQQKYVLKIRIRMEEVKSSILWYRYAEKLSVADPGCLARIPDPTFFPSRIPDLNCFHPGTRIRIKEFKYFNPKKWFLSSRKYGPGCSSRIWILTFYPSRIPDPGVKKALDPGSGSATLLKIRNRMREANSSILWYNSQ